MARMSRTISGARPRLGSSSISRRGADISARPSASICRSPPESVLGALRAPLGQPRKARVDRVRCGCFSAARPQPLRIGAELQVVEHAELAEQLALLRHQAQAALDARLDVETVRASSPSKRSVPRLGSRPIAAASSVVLPAPFGPITETIWPGSERRARRRAPPRPGRRTTCRSPISSIGRHAHALRTLRSGAALPPR